jgi:hypothetical protein
VRSAERAQISLSLVEAGIGVVLLLAVTMGFAIGLPEPDTTEPQLELYAEDTAAVLAGDPPRHRGATRLEELLTSNETFQRERADLANRVERILTDNLMYRVETRYGAVGYRKPVNAPVGTATVTTANGEVTITVWYA